ncbi:MAG TPA: glycosyltransferase family 2 protein [Planctomycetota bacterium]|nr:glycosyltransferase family 2 protein [Planctomycetota bacterium]HRR78846.1 glycosyltransferase family 2 protein [Planctomycetota bacterium]HRT92848.1 glycosyltransferase family 2 protein [Planctomycetota bacterium]
MEPIRPQLSIVIPAYNESADIEAAIEAATAFLAQSRTPGEVIVVDDGSTDDTAALTARYAASQPAVRLLRNGRNRGKGYSVRRGVLEARGEVILFSDADESTPFSEAPKLLAPIAAGAADVAIGSRALRESRLELPQPWMRRVMGWVFRNLVRLLVMRGIRDTQCGFKAFRAAAAREVFPRQTLEGFAFDVEVLFIARKLGYHIVEVPVRWLDSHDSRVRPLRDPVRMFLDLLRIRLRAWRGAYAEAPRS